LRRHVADFLKAKRGNIAVTFVIALVPILTFIGAAIDYSRVSLARTAMQAALDSTALMLSRDLASGTITQSQIGNQAQAYFAALYTNPDAQSVSITATYTPGGSGAK
jgi:Flp pilus assembly protein TadG